MTNNGHPVENVTIIGSGPAAWTAAIYAARSNLSPIVYEGVPKQDPTIVLPGGQLMLTTDVENYPGYPDGVEGPKMMEDFKNQAQRFGTRIVTDDIVNCDFERRPFKLETASGETIYTHAAIVATGATANWLGLENEQRLAQSGGGVSACAVCDGALPMFRDQPLAVVGGGDTAMEEADHLAKFGSKVYVIHRRDHFRASATMQKRVLNNPKCEVIWHSEVVDVLGQDKVSGVKIHNNQSGEAWTLDVKGFFVAIGHTPATQFLAGTGLEFNEGGYLQLQNNFKTYTNIEGVFAAGDVADETYKQAVTAASMGCKAAIDAERWLSANELLEEAAAQEA